MPAITVEAGSLTNEQKAELGKVLTEDAARIMKMPKEAIMIFLKENPLENVIFGGVQVSELNKKK
ncbi:MAG: tautomerase family protein [Selenomonadaceae bacterium]|nr:tautomerase family protein [Selenomonadaceae bacterium]